MNNCDKYKHLIIYWIQRLHIPISMQDDCTQIGYEQILTDQDKMSENELHYKVSYRVAKAIGRHMASAQGYKSLEYGAKDNWRRNISLDALPDAGEYIYNYTDDSTQDRYTEIWQLVSADLLPAELELINIVFFVPESHLKPFERHPYKQLLRGRKVTKWNKSDINHIRLLAKSLNYDTKCSLSRLLERIRLRIIRKVCKLLNDKQLADIEVIYNPKNSYKPFIINKLR